MIKSKTSLEDLERDLEEGYSGNALQLKEGDNIVRLIVEKGYVRYFMHYNILETLSTAADDSNLRNGVPCLKEFGKDCPICEYSSLLYKSMNEDDQEKGKRIFRNERYAFTVLDRSEKKEGVSPVKILNCGKMVALGIKDCGKRYGDPSHPEKGYDLNIILKIVGNRNKYEVAPVFKVDETGGRRSYSIVETPVTAEEKNCRFPDLEDVVTEPVVDDVVAAFDPLILEVKEKLSKEGERDPVKKEVRKEESPRPVSEKKEEKKEEPKLVKVEEALSKLPRCFGMCDETDVENCGSCSFKKACKERVEGKEGIKKEGGSTKPKVSKTLPFK